MHFYVPTNLMLIMFLFLGAVTLPLHFNIFHEYASALKTLTFLLKFYLQQG